jgi:hypothetical protein
MDEVHLERRLFAYEYFPTTKPLVSETSTSTDPNKSYSMVEAASLRNEWILWSVQPIVMEGGPPDYSLFLIRISCQK